MITQLFKVVRSDSVMAVCCENVFSILSGTKYFRANKYFLIKIPPVSETMDSDTLPAIEDSPVTVTLVKLSSVASTCEPLAVWRPGNTGEAVLVTVGHLIQYM